MFDEKNPIWIKVYKILVIVSAVVILIAGFIWAKEEATWYRYGSHFDSAEFLIYFAIAVAIAVVDYVSGMLVANFLSNVQTIREKLEEK